MTLEEVWDTVREEFTDIGDGASIVRIVVRLLVAVVLGGVLGWERESVGAPAGLRTHMLVSLGSALFVLIPLQAGMKMEEIPFTDKIAAQAKEAFIERIRNEVQVGFQK